MRRTLLSCVVVIAAVLVIASAASAQSGSSIAGVVKDTTGAIMPGVTVEASSPALIEKVRICGHRRGGPVQDRQRWCPAPTP